MLGCGIFNLGTGLINGLVDADDSTLLSLEWESLEVRLAKLGVAVGRCITVTPIVGGGKRKTMDSSLTESRAELASNIFGSNCMGHSGEIGTRLASFFVLRRWYNKPKVRSEARSRNPMIPPTTAPIVVFVGKDVFDAGRCVACCSRLLQVDAGIGLIVLKKSGNDIYFGCSESSTAGLPIDT